MKVVTPDARRDHWRRHAAQWARIGSPLKPHPQDIVSMRSFLGAQPGRGLMLGVTPELCALSDELLAIDRDASMIERVWRPRAPGQLAIQGDWLDLPSIPPSADRSFDFVVGDGSLNVLRHAVGPVRLFEQLESCLRAGAPIVTRVFVAPEIAEEAEDLMTKAHAGRIGSFHVFKWRLAMALVAEDGSPDIRVARIHQAFCELVPDRALLSTGTGWPLDDIDTIDVYSGSDMSYSFPTLTQLVDVLAPHAFVVGIAHGQYELAQCCPVVAWQLRAHA